MKVVHRRAEEARVEVRNHRRDAADEVRRQEKAGEMGADDARRELERVEKVTHQWIEQVDQAARAKEQEIMEV